MRPENFAVQYQGKNGSVSGEGMTNNGRGASVRMATVSAKSITYDYEGFGIGADVPAPNVLMIRTSA
ncbi:hypothetical protein ACLK19_14730 [Escherichia coli]